MSAHTTTAVLIFDTMPLLGASRRGMQTDAAAISKVRPTGKPMHAIVLADVEITKSSYVGQTFGHYAGK
jgi:hypothetical protein